MGAGGRADCSLVRCPWRRGDAALGGASDVFWVGRRARMIDRSPVCSCFNFSDSAESTPQIGFSFLFRGCVLQTASASNLCRSVRNSLIADRGLTCTEFASVQSQIQLAGAGGVWRLRRVHLLPALSCAGHATKVCVCLESAESLSRACIEASSQRQPTVTQSWPVGK